MMRPRPVRLITAALALTSILGCHAQPPPNSGRSGGRLDPTHDSPAESGVFSLRSPDLVTATDHMAQDIASRLDLNDPGNPSRIYVGLIENKTSAPNDDYQVFLARLRAQLQRSGSRNGLEFIRERSFVEYERDREFGGKDPENTAEAYTSEAEYVLTCEVFDLPAGGTNYFMLDYQLVQLVDRAASGPDAGRGRIVWENLYEVKYQ